jgi:hypothetical protein
MKVDIIDRLTGEEVKGGIISVDDEFILPANESDWKFTWRQLYRSHPNSLFFQLNLTSSSNQIEGLVMLSLVMGEMLFMHNIEVAPHNLGQKGRYGRVAGCLIAYSCSLSLNLGKGEYRGYLSFISKTELVELYCKKYGAKIAVGQNLYFDPEASKKLISAYLSHRINPNLEL